jgi:hypothetical protein
MLFHVLAGKEVTHKTTGQSNPDYEHRAGFRESHCAGDGAGPGTPAVTEALAYAVFQTIVLASLALG